MKKLLFTFLLVSCLLSNSFAEDNSAKIRVLILDSGTDLTHPKLNPIADPDLAEKNGTKGKDDNGNGYIDDVYGWNFPDNSPLLVDLKNTPKRYDDILRFMELMGKFQQVGKDKMKPDEFQQLKVLYNDKELKPWINYVGGWAHGTHCGGIAARNNKSISMKGVKHIPTGNAPIKQAAKLLQKLNFELLQDNFSGTAGFGSFIKKKVILAGFKKMGKTEAEKIKPEADYLASLKPRVVNCSFGAPNENLLKMFKQNMPKWGYKNPSDKEVQEFVNKFVTLAFLPRDKALFSPLKNALIVFAAGNSSENMDPVVGSPNNTPIDNKIVVAATNKNKSLATFSCYGKKNVDVAVPGVNINSTFPNKKEGYMSGTSMAAPLAAKYASLIFAVNPKFTPVQVKSILMGTVDKKPWLKEKVKSGGVINIKRALAAAKALKAGKSLSKAIMQSFIDVAATASTRPEGDAVEPKFKTAFEKELYKSSLH
ncbi:S8 family serine peptidase [Candidatus Riflebacteria bacterium]